MQLLYEYLSPRQKQALDLDTGHVDHRRYSLGSHRDGMDLVRLSGKLHL
jgi:hypothetical protein